MTGKTDIRESARDLQKKISRRPPRSAAPVFLLAAAVLCAYFSACGRTGFWAGAGAIYPEVCADYPRIVDAPGQVGTVSSVAFDRHGIPHIAYYDMVNKRLKYAQAVTSQAQCGWVIAVADDEGELTGLYPNLVIPEDNIPRIAYMAARQDSQQGVHYELRFAEKATNPDGTFEWRRNKLDDSGYRGNFATMVVGPDRLYHLVTLNGRTMDLEYGYYDGANPPKFEPALSLAGYNVIDVQVSLAVTPGGVPLIAIHHPINQLWLVQRSAAPPNSGTWQVTVVETNQYFQDIGRFVSLAVDERGLPHLCHFRWDQSRSELWYNHYDGSAWQRSVVDSEGVTGANCSIALNASGLPVISYLNSTNNDLRVAFLRDPERMRWEIWTADYSMATGYSSDLAISAAGNIGISYYDFSVQGLKFYWIGFY